MIVLVVVDIEYFRPLALTVGHFVEPFADARAVLRAGCHYLCVMKTGLCVVHQLFYLFVVEQIGLCDEDDLTLFQLFSVDVGSIFVQVSVASIKD